MYNTTNYNLIIAYDMSHKPITLRVRAICNSHHIIINLAFIYFS